MDTATTTDTLAQREQRLFRAMSAAAARAVQPHATLAAMDAAEADLRAAHAEWFAARADLAEVAA